MVDISPSEYTYILNNPCTESLYIEKSTGKTSCPVWKNIQPVYLVPLQRPWGIKDTLTAGIETDMYIPHIQVKSHDKPWISKGTTEVDYKHMPYALVDFCTCDGKRANSPPALVILLKKSPKKHLFQSQILIRNNMKIY